MDYGVPRPGHPEGTIRSHIKQVESNLERLKPELTDVQYWRLRILALVHDAFKRDANKFGDGVKDRRLAITDPNSHASLAHAYLAGYEGIDSDLLNMIQYHDEAYACYVRWLSDKADNGRLSRLISLIQDWDTFGAFLIADGTTEGKDNGQLKWLESRLSNNNSHFLKFVSLVH